MRDLMLLAFALYATTLLIAGALGNTGLWIAFLVFLSVRGLGQALLCPRLTRQAFAGGTSSAPG
jgi:MATE family multidrug resistance protein